MLPVSATTRTPLDESSAYRGPLSRNQAGTRAQRAQLHYLLLHPLPPTKGGGCPNRRRGRHRSPGAGRCAGPRALPRPRGRSSGRPGRASPSRRRAREARRRSAGGRSGAGERRAGRQGVVRRRAAGGRAGAASRRRERPRLPARSGHRRRGGSRRGASARIAARKAVRTVPAAMAGALRSPRRPRDRAPCPRPAVPVLERLDGPGKRKPPALRRRLAELDGDLTAIVVLDDAAVAGIANEQVAVRQLNGKRRRGENLRRVRQLFDLAVGRHLQDAVVAGVGDQPRTVSRLAGGARLESRLPRLPGSRQRPTCWTTEPSRASSTTTWQNSSATRRFPLRRSWTLPG